MKIPIEIKSKYLITSFTTDMLLATFDNIAGMDNRLIYGFFHINVGDDFYDYLGRYDFIEVVLDENIDVGHTAINIVAFMPQKGYTNRKMERMFCDVLRKYCPELI